MQEFVIKGNPKDIMDQVDKMVNEDDRVLYEKRMEEGDNRERDIEDGWEPGNPQ